MKTIRGFCVFLFLASATSALAGPPTFEAQPSPTPSDENSRDLFSYETTYTFGSDFKESKLGDGDSLYNDFSYDHRFLITGKWYFRAGVEYERYDFGGSDNGLPDHLQAASAHLALEYVVKNFPGISIELDPGVYFQDEVSGRRFRYPRESLCDIPLKERQDLCRCRFGLGNLSGPAGCAGWRHHLAYHRQAAPSGGFSETCADLSAKRRLGFADPRRA